MKSPNRVERWLPLGYFVVAAVLVLAVLPSVLRVQPPDTNSSAALSPDAPPEDDQQQSIVAATGRASSATAGAIGDESSVDATAALPLPAPAAVGRCFGKPPRQTDSPYAPPCTGAFTGDNGGDTWRGVTATEVRIGVALRDVRNNVGQQGEIQDPPRDGENSQERTYRVFAQYFNERFQLYGRRIRLFVRNNTDSENVQMTNAVAMDEEHKVFATVGTGADFITEVMRRGIVNFGSFQNPLDFYRRHSPLAYSFQMDGTRLMRLTGEAVCKQLAGRPVQWAGESDAARNGGPRIFGAIVLEKAPNREGDADRLRAILRDECGVELKAVLSYQETSGADQNFAAGIARLQAEGVTTVLCQCDSLGPITMTRLATAQAWFPEWFVVGSLLTDRNDSARLYDTRQWNRAFGISPLEEPRPYVEQDWYQAYKSVDPGGEPNADIGQNAFRDLLHVVGGIQRAGPLLTPDTFRQGIESWPGRAADPVWTVGGSYGPDDHTYADVVAFVWWDPAAPDPATGQPGAYRYPLGGRRFATGELPTEPVGWFGG